MNKLDLVATHPDNLFYDINLDALSDEIKLCSERTFDEGAVILDPRSKNESIFILTNGECLVCLEPQATDPVATLQAGDCIGELSIIDDRPPSAYVIADTRCRAIEIPGTVLWEMLEKQQKIAVNLLHLLARRIRQNNEAILAGMAAQKQLQQIKTDSLTDLHTRVWMEEIFPGQLDLSGKIGQPISLMILDLDDFKALNETHGSLAGDIMLANVSRVMQASLRNTDLSIRYDGDQFITLMPASDISKAQFIAERLCQQVASSSIHIPDGQKISVTVSIGVAEWHPNLSNNELIHLANKALGQAKDNGHNQVAIYEAS